MPLPLETVIVKPVDQNGNLDPKVPETISEVAYSMEVLVLPPLSKHPNPTGFLASLSTLGRRIELLLRPEELRETISAIKILGDPSVEIIVYDPPLNSISEVIESLRVAFENGAESLSLYLICRGEAQLKRALSSIHHHSGKPPISIRIGPPLYESYGSNDALSIISGVVERIGLPYGVLYGYIARRAWLREGIPVTILSTPCPRGCRKLYLTSKGASRCPFTSMISVPINSISPEKILRFVQEECLMKKPRSRPIVTTGVEIRLNGVRVPQDILEVLTAIKMTGSLRAACKSLGLHASRVLAKIKNIEEKSGAKLVEGKRGGVGGGYTILTPAGEEVVAKYMQIKTMVQ